MAVPFSVTLSLEAVMAIRRMAKRTGLPQSKILGLAIQLLEARHTDQWKNFRKAFDAANRRYRKTLRELTE